MRQIVLADNQDITRMGLAYILKQENVAEFHSLSNKRELHAFLQINQESVVVLDYVLFDFESANELIVLNSTYPKVDWVLFSDENYRDWETDRKSTRLNSSHRSLSRMPSSA